MVWRAIWTAFVKSMADTATEDHELLSGQYLNHWAVIANCGYQGAQVDAQVIFLIKQPRSTNLSVYKNQFDINLSKDHASVENFLGCMKTM